MKIICLLYAMSREFLARTALSEAFVQHKLHDVFYMKAPDAQFAAHFVDLSVDSGAGPLFQVFP